MKKFIVYVQQIFPVIGLIGGGLGILGKTIEAYQDSKLPYLHYNYGVSGMDLVGVEETFIIISLEIGFLFIFIPLLYWLMRKVFIGGQAIKNPSKLLLIGALIYFFLFVVWPNPNLKTLYFGNRGEYRKQDISSNLRYIRKSNVISNIDAEHGLNYLPDSSPFKKYSPEMTLLEKKALIRELSEWWLINKNYLVWDDKTHKFIMDEEAKAARIWTDEYRKTYPWPKEPDKTDGK